VRIGFGYDVHRLKQGRRCVLCGVEIPCSVGPDGHSDADVPAHALIDALLGALSLGDIGLHFPDNNEQWKDADSMDLLKSAYALVKSHGYVLGNADITIVAEQPRISEHVVKMRGVIAETLDTDISNISVKATTEEKLGFTGDGSGISATAAVLLLQN